MTRGNNKEANMKNTIVGYYCLEKKAVMCPKCGDAEKDIPIISLGSKQTGPFGCTECGTTLASEKGKAK